MRKLLALFVCAALGATQAHADSTVSALPTTTSALSSGLFYFDQGPLTDTKLGIDATLFTLSTGKLTIASGTIGNGLLSNSGVTVNSVSCTLGGSCTVTVSIGSGVTGLGTGVATVLGNALNGASGPIGNLTPTNGNCPVGNGTSWASTTCPGGTPANPTATISGSAVNGVASTFMRSDAAPALATTAVTPGSYTNTNLTVDANGRITAATNGSSAGATGVGVDGGTSASSVTAGGTIGNSVRLVKVASGWATGTLTLPAISAVSPDSCIRVEDGGAFVDGTHTLTVAANAVDSINGGSTGGNTGAFVSNGVALSFCVTATHNWNVLVSTAIAATTAPSHQFFNSLSGVGVLGSAQPAVGDISGFGTGVATAAGNNLSAAGGLTTTIASGTSALGTGAITSGTCATVVTTSATNTATTDVVLASFNGDPTAVTGYIPSTSGMLTIISYPTANNVNFKVCNNTSSSVTPGAITLNWRVVR